MCRQIVTDDYVGDDRRKYEEWHLDKNVPISIIVALLVYAGIAIWWGSQMQAQIQVVQKEQEKKAIEEKERVIDSLMNNKIDNIRALIGPINQTLVRLDVKLDSINENVITALKEHERNRAKND
jgi:flagellar basal body-associated protein FliL